LNNVEAAIVGFQRSDYARIHLLIVMKKAQLTSTKMNQLEGMHITLDAWAAISANTIATVGNTPAS